ncbi:g-type lectin s-receptor-like serine/threonine-protein kinase lecrk2 [Quercus suber]|uniref:G-type lectin s-receptor-like serine/threonine-protein kinase lecrk2 n=1 Tax=Quercus suber TaxID=58331 RepID=A0AAW0LMA0_QUESU
MPIQLSGCSEFCFGHFHSFSPYFAQALGITAGSDSSWKSPSGDFAFGFYPLVTNLYLVVDYYTGQYQLEIQQLDGNILLSAFRFSGPAYWFSATDNNGNISPNTSINSGITAGSNDSLLSLNGDFAFGFYALQNGLYLVGVWFDGIPEKTLVWSANRDSPAEQGSKIKLTIAGDFIIAYANGSILQIYSGYDTSLGTMQNDGNFVLRDGSSRIVWQSFDSPTNTLLPGQVLVQSQKLYSNAKGSSNSNYSTGDFMLEMQFDGNLVLSAYHFADPVDYSTGQYELEIQQLDGNILLSAFRFSGPAYWFSATDNNGNVSLVFSKTTAFMYAIFVEKNSMAYKMTSKVPTPIEDYYHKATINDKGNFQQLSFFKRNGSSKWDVVWEAITKPCTVDNICGVYGFCSTPDGKIANCTCLPGYSPLDPNTPSKGCYPNVVMDFCAPNSSASNFTIQTLNDADNPNHEFADLARIQQTDADNCKKEVMDDCFCVAAVFNSGNNVCYKKRMPLVNSRSNPTTNNMVVFIKVPVENHDFDPKDKKESSSCAVLLASFLSCSIFAVLFVAIAIYHHPLAQHWVLSCVRAANLEATVINDSELLSDYKRFERMALVGVWCTCSNPTLRPSMKKVVQMLEGTVEVDVPPLFDAQMF